jgi:hypothetical protein
MKMGKKRLAKREKNLEDYSFSFSLSFRIYPKKQGKTTD